MKMTLDEALEACAKLAKATTDAKRSLECGDPGGANGCLREVEDLAVRIVENHTDPARVVQDVRQLRQETERFDRLVRHWCPPNLFCTRQPVLPTSAGCSTANRPSVTWDLTLTRWKASAIPPMVLLPFSVWTLLSPPSRWA